MTPPSLPPLRFTPLFKHRIWGGRTLETRLGKRLPPHTTIGESWEITGYGSEQSRVSSGPFAGARIEDLLRREGTRLVGNHCGCDVFPLLYKFIDANDRLSIQVHPNDEQARRSGQDQRGKTECWYVADAVPGATIIVGFREGVSRNDILPAIESRTLDTLLNRFSVQKGDLLYIPAGTVHAILDGTLVYEVQETSDVTLRLYDWGRLDERGNPRELHVEPSLQVLDFCAHHQHRIEGAVVESGANLLRTFRVACRYFAIEELHFLAAGTAPLWRRDSFQVICVMEGAAEVISPHGSEPLATGESILIPAACTDVAVCAEEGGRVLVSWVPDLHADVIAPLRKSGLDDSIIARVGGYDRSNDLLPLLTMQT